MSKISLVMMLLCMLIGCSTPTKKDPPVIQCVIGDTVVDGKCKKVYTLDVLTVYDEITKLNDNCKLVEGADWKTSDCWPKIDLEKYTVQYKIEDEYYDALDESFLAIGDLRIDVFLTTK